MDDKIEQALVEDRTIDITTIGRNSGNRHRIEIWFHNLDGALYITGRPGRKRDWYANLVANPDFTFHLKDTVQADLSARATPITEEAPRREILARILAKLGFAEQEDLSQWVAESPLVAVELADASAAV